MNIQNLAGQVLPMLPKEDCLTANEQKKLLELLERQKLSSGRYLYFFEALTELFPGTNCYYYAPEKKFLLSLPYQQTTNNEARLQYLCYWFLDVTVKYQTYWEYPFGIIGKNDTMHIDQMRLYSEERD